MNIKKPIVYILIAGAIGYYVTNHYKVEKRLLKLELQQQVFIESEKNCVKEALWYEARNQKADGILAVMSVIENRKNHPNYPGTYCSVIWQPSQFSYSQKGSGSTLEASVKLADKDTYALIDVVAENAVQGRFKSLLPAGVLWYTTTSVNNYWTKTKMKFKKIRDHVFYKDKPKKGK
jgi:spore germination cell wall hydrolase CwlJ-like protein